MDPIKQILKVELDLTNYATKSGIKKVKGTIICEIGWFNYSKIKCR